MFYLPCRLADGLATIRPRCSTLTHSGTHTYKVNSMRSASPSIFPAAACVTTIRSFASSLLPSTCVVSLFRALHLGGWSSQERRRCMGTKAGSNLPSGVNIESSSIHTQLMQLGFTDKEATHVLSRYASRLKTRSFSIGNVHAWLQLLGANHVKHPHQVLCKHVIILSSKAATAEANADGVVTWFHSLGATNDMTAALLSKRPMLLIIPHKTAVAVTVWLHSQLGWSSSMILSTLMRQPALFNYSIAHNNSQVSALQGMGFSAAQVNQILRKKPELLIRDISSRVTQTKVRFLTEVMKKSVEELLTCPAFFTYSVMERIGPRWGFHSRYFAGQTFVLGSRLTVTNEIFAQSLVSPSLEAECAARVMPRPQVYAEFKLSWKQGEGKMWDV